MVQGGGEERRDLPRTVVFVLVVGSLAPMGALRCEWGAAVGGGEEEKAYFECAVRRNFPGVFRWIDATDLPGGRAVGLDTSDHCGPQPFLKIGFSFELLGVITLCLFSIYLYTEPYGHRIFYFLRASASRNIHIFAYSGVM